MIIDIINQMIEHNLQRMNVQDDLEEKKVWKYENSFDYHYGRTIGLLTRVCREEFEKLNKRPARPEEVLEIVKILEENAVRIRQALAIFKR